MAFVMGSPITQADTDRMPDYPVRFPWYDKLMREDPCRPLDAWMFDYFPSVALVDSDRHGLLTDWLAYGFDGIRSRTRDIIEALEPGVHQFIPLKVRYTHHGKGETHDFFTLKINQRADLCLESEMEFTFEQLLPNRPPVRRRRLGTPYVFRRNDIRNLHLWRQFEPEPEFLMSTPLKEALGREGLLNGLPLTPCRVID